MNDDVKIIATGVTIVVLFIIGIGFIQNYLSKESCQNNVTEMGKNYRYDWINGCRIEYEPGKFIYWEMYRNIHTN